MPFKSFSVVFGILLVVPAAAFAQTTQPFTPLFDGKSFAGWYTYLKDTGKNSDPKKVFQIDPDGVIHIYKDAEQGSDQPFGYFCTEKDYGDCRLRFQYKWGEKRFGKRATARRDSGVLYFTWGEDGKGNGVWPYSIECQIQENDVGDIYCVGTQCSSTIDPKTKDAKQPTFMEDSAGGVPYTTPPKGNNRIIRSEMLEKDGWNTIELVMKGDSAVHIINGKVNMRISNAKAPNMENKDEMLKVTKGKILLQAEGAEVMYRNIEVAPLEPEPAK